MLLSLLEVRFGYPKGASGSLSLPGLEKVPENKNAGFHNLELILLVL